MDIKKTFVYFLFFGIIFSFFYGFLSGENSAGAGGYNGDLSWIIKNIEIFKNHSIVDAIKHPDIYGNRPPLIYILNKLFNPFFYDLEKYRICVFILSLLGPIFLFLGLKIKFKDIKNEYLALLSVIILLSPYYRTSAFWALNENYGIVTAILSLFFLNLSLSYSKVDETKNRLYYFFTIIFSSLSVYFDQKLIIIPLICLFTFLFRLKKIKTMILICCGYGILSIPFLYLIFLWNGIVPVKTQLANPNTITNLSRVSNFYFINIGYATTIISFYLLPLIFLKENPALELKKQILNKSNFMIIAFIIVYIIFLLNYFDFKKYTVDEYWVGLGYIDKVSKIAFSNIIIREYFTYFSFFVSWIVLIFFLEKKVSNFLILFYFFFMSILLWPLMQEYFDPLILIFGLMIFLSKIKINFYNIIFTIFYFAIFIVSANIYY